MRRQPPLSPSQVSVFYENGSYVFRLDDSQAIYYYDLDTAEVSSCDSECLQAWQPVVPEDGSHPVGDWNIIERADGSRQWTYKKRPVYVFLKDVPGKALGDGKDGLWHAVDP